jgi:hypothetical protein
MSKGESLSGFMVGDFVFRKSSPSPSSSEVVVTGGVYKVCEVSNGYFGSQSLTVAAPNGTECRGKSSSRFRLATAQEAIRAGFKLKGWVTKKEDDPEKNPDLDVDYRDTKTEVLIKENISLLKQIVNLRGRVSPNFHAFNNAPANITCKALEADRILIERAERKTKFYIRNRKELESRLPKNLRDAFHILEAK